METKKTWLYENGDVYEKETCIIIAKVTNEEYGEKIADALNTLEASQELHNALKDCMSDLFYQIESKHGAEKAYNYPSYQRGLAAIKKASK